MNEIFVEEAVPADFEAIQNFYKMVDYDRPVQSSDYFVIAKDEGNVIGVVRLCQEKEFLVLCGMHVHEHYQRRGIGTQMMHKLVQKLRDQTCYCLPQDWLEEFYTQIGFHKIDTNEVPSFVQSSLSPYHLPEADILMVRPSENNS